MADQPHTGSPERATITIDGEGWFQAVSPSFLSLIGRPVESLSGLNLIDLVHPHDAAGARHLVAAIAAADSAQATRDLRLFTAGDTWTAARVAVRGVGDGKIVLDAVVLNPAAPPVTSSSAPSSPVIPAGAAVSSVIEFEPSSVVAAVQPVVTTPPARESTAAGQPSASVETSTALGSAPTVSVAAQGANDPHQRYLAALPGSHVAEQRAAIRASLSGSNNPMIEIDANWHTSFVRGDWGSLIAGDAVGEYAFEALLTSSGNADAVGSSIDRAIQTAQPAIIEVTSELGTRFVHVRPIPSPQRAGSHHALIAVSEQSQLAAADLSHIEHAAARVAVSPPATVAAAVAATAVAKPVTPIIERVSESADQPGPRPIATLLADRLKPITDWMQRRGISGGQLAGALSVMLVALVLRTWDLSELPSGFHGDEAITGQEAQRVLNEGSIGVYTGSALGQPTAPFYLYSIGVALFGPTIWGTRIIAAVGGVLAVGATYLMVQRRFDHRTGVASALVLAMMTWSIHFSRIAFGLAWWPLGILLAIAAIDRATKHITWRNWLVAGAWSSFGIYVYNSHIGFGLVVVAFMAVWLASRVVREKGVNVKQYLPVVGGLGGALLVGLPMLSYARGGNGFSNHFTHVGRTSGEVTPGWDSFGLSEKISNVAGWYYDSWGHLLSTSPEGVDGVDASGIVPQIPRVILLLAVVGAVVALLRHRSAFMGLVLLTVVVMPLLPAITFQGNTRRGYAMAPCIAILAGIGAVAIYALVADKINVRSGTYAAIALTAIVFFSSVMPYFTTFRNDTRQRWIFAEELTTTVDAVHAAAEDGPVFVNWFSGRHYYGYETMAYLLDGVPGANRTPLEDGFIVDPTLELTDGIDSDQLYVFVGDYTVHLDRLRAMFPEGSVILDNANPRIVAYEVPGP